MAENRPTRRGGRYCVAGAPNQQSCTNTTFTPGVKMHQFPADPVVREKWIKFVQRHRHDFREPTKYASLCSVHFEDACYSKSLASQLTDIKFNNVLIKGSIPTKDTVIAATPEPLSQRGKRQLRREVLSEVNCQEPIDKRKKVPSTVSFDVSSSPDIDDCIQDPKNNNENQATSEIPIHTKKNHTCETPQSICCHKSKLQNYQRSNNRLKKRVMELKKNVRELKRKIPPNEYDTEDDGESSNENDLDKIGEEGGGEQQQQQQQQPSSQYYVWSSYSATESSDEMPHDEDSDWTCHTESTEEENTDAEPEDNAYSEVNVDSSTKSIDEPKFIVFYSSLMTIFSLFCFNCKEPKPVVTMKKNGTMVKVTQSCGKCIFGYVWQSQPFILNKYPAGNILLSFSILMAGASISKVLLMFRHMGLCAYTARSFFNHQRNLVFPTILQYWESYQSKLITQLKAINDVVWCGDGRYDSMGHSAKYGIYTMLSTTVMKIIHFEVVQANETGGSQQTELEGVKRCFSFLERAGLAIGVFISDRHKGIAKWVREQRKNTKHFYDIWHVAKSVTKKLLAASNETGCEAIKHWIKGIRRHMFWCATSTRSGFGDLIVAKWKSFTRHVSNIHSDHPDPLYKNCNHGELEKRLWIKRGTAAHDKLESILTKTSLIGNIKMLSPNAQTSALEGFHATLNHWHPKMIAFSWLGTTCRHILASLHFNENVNRETQEASNGSKYYKVTYPKFKLGEEVVREVPVPPTYGYVDSMKDFLFSTSHGELKITLAKYHNKTPKPLCSKFPEKLPKPEAVKKFQLNKERNQTPLFPSVADQETLLGLVKTTKTTKKNTRKAPHCKKCKKPMRGHRITTCQAP